MGTFAYEAVNQKGKIIAGQMEAQAENVAYDNLSKQGHTVIEIREVQPSLFRNLLQKPAKVSVGDLSLFARQLAAMIDAGVPLTRSLHTLSAQMTNKGMGRVVADVARNVEGGMNLTDALAKYPGIFSSLFTGMVGAGEVGGGLQEALSRLSDQLQKDKFLKDSMKSATFYPAAIGAFAVLLLLGMLFFLVPIFMGFFPPDMPLPLPTQIVVLLSDSLRSWWYIWFTAACGFFMAARIYLRSRVGKRHWDLVKFRIPLFGPLLHRAVIAQFARTLSTLFSGGIPVVKALQSAAQATGNILVIEAATAAAEKVQEGRSIAGPLGDSPIFPPMVTQMVSIGEETGSLPDLLNRIAAFFEDEVAIMAKGLTAMIEPVMLIVVGLTVGTMLMALYLPIFTMITQGI